MLLRAAAALHILSALLDACSCSGPLTRCGQFHSAEVAFIGTVTGFLGENPQVFGREPHIVRVDEILKGLDSNRREVRLFASSGSSCSAAPSIGKQYVFFARRRAGSDELITGSCDGSFEITSQNRKWVDALANAIRSGSNFVHGDVRVTSRWPDFRLPLQSPGGVQLSLKSKQTNIQPMSDQNGEYWLTGLPAGAYNVSASYNSQAGILSLGSFGPAISEFSVPEVGCVDFNASFPVVASLRGVAYSSKSQPLEDALVTLLPTGAASASRLSFPTTTATVNGEFVFGDIDQGRYLVLVRENPQQPSGAFRSTFYPSSLSPSEATVIEIPSRDSDLPGPNIRIQARPMPTHVDVKFQISPSQFASQPKLRLHLKSPTYTRNLAIPSWYADCASTSAYCTVPLPQGETFEATLESPTRSIPLGRHTATPNLIVTAQPTVQP